MAPIALTGNLGATIVLLHRRTSWRRRQPMPLYKCGGMQAQRERHAVRWAHFAIPVADRAGHGAGSVTFSWRDGVFAGPRVCAWAERK